MVKRQIQLLDITAVANGGKAVIEPPLGWRYHDIFLVMGDSAAGDANAPATCGAIITDINILINGESQREVTADRLDAINTDMGSDYASQGYAGVANGSGRRHLGIYFGEPWRKRLVDQDGLAWQTGHLARNGSFQIEVGLSATAGVVPVLTAFATVDDFSAGKPHGIMKWYTNNYNVAGASVDLLKLQRREPFAQITAFNTSDAKSVTEARLLVGGVEVIKRTRNEMTTFLKSRSMAHTAGRFHLVFDHDDYLDDMLPITASEMQLTLGLSAASAGTLPLVSQVFGVPNQS